MSASQTVPQVADKFRRPAKIRALRVLHVFTEHRGKGGAEHHAKANMELCRSKGLTIGLFTRTSDDLPHNLWGRIQAGVSAISPTVSLREFAAAADAFRPDVVHLYDYFPLISPWVASLCAQRGIPVVLDCVHYRLTCPIVTHYSGGESCTRCTGGREYWAMLRNCRQNLPESITVALHSAMTRKFQPILKHVSRFLAPSDFTRQWLIDQAGVDESRITTTNTFVDFPAEAVDPSAGEYVAFAGRFSAEKGIHTALDAARIAGLPLRLCRNASHLVGITLPEGSEQVVTRNREELQAFYRGARMLVFPSQWFETFGLVGAEAMSHGVPVVAARIGALADLVDHEQNGLLFDAGNPADLAEKMLRLWNDRELCRRLGQAARQKVQANWTPEHYFNRLYRIYEEVCAKPRG